MKKLLLMKTVLLLFALVVGSSSVWADSYTITFKTGTGDGSSASTSTACSTIVSAGSSYLSGNLATDTRVYYGGSAGLKLGASSDAGVLKMNLANNVKPTSIVVNAKRYNKAATIAANGKTAQNLTSSFADYTFTFDGNTEISYIQLNSSKYCWVASVTVNYTNSSVPSISADDVDILYTATSGSITYSVSNPVTGGALTAARTAGDWLTVGEVGASSVAFTCSANTGSQRTATVRLTYTYNTSETVTKDVKVTQAPAPQNYTLASSLTSGKIYVIASGTSGDVKVMGEQKDTNRGTVDGTVSETTLTTTSAAEVVAYGPDASGYYTLYTADGYLYAASSDKNQMKSQSTNDMNGKWSISIDGETKEAEVVAQGTNTRNIIHYNPNNGSPVYSCYGSSSSIDNPVYLFEKADAAVATTVSKTLNASGYATFATTTALDFLDAEKANFSAWEIKEVSSTTITFSQITDHVKAGTGILLKGTPNATINLNILPTGGANISSTNKLVAITESTDVTADQYYGLSGNQFKKVNAGTVPAGKALLPASAITSSARELNFVFDEATGIKQVETSKSIIEGIYNLAGQKVQNPTKGLYIMNGKKVIIK